MLKDCVAILSIGSSNVNIIVGEKSVNDTFNLKVNLSHDYYSFLNGEFIDIKELESIILKMLNDITKSNEISEISKIFVGIPGEFSKTITKNYKITFNSYKTITNKDLTLLYDLAFEDNDLEYSLAHRSKVYYLVDNVKTLNPIGSKGLSLAGRLCFSLVSNNFKEVLTNILKKAGITTVNFISEDYALSQYLFDKTEKDACKILVDVGNTTTSFSISVGDGLLYSGSIPYGGGLITAYLYEKFECDYSVAEQLKRKINLGLINDDTASYLINAKDGEVFKFSRNESNEIAKNVLDKIAEEFENAFKQCPLKIPTDADTYFTGGGICYIRGAVEYVSTRIGVLPKIIKPSLPHYSKPDYSAKISLLNTALCECNSKIFFKK